MNCQHDPIAIGHAIICRRCLAPLQSWGVTTPIIGEPRKHEWPSEDSLHGYETFLMDVLARRVN